MKRTFSYLSLLLILVSTMIFSPLALAAKKVPEFSITSVKEMKSTIVDINTAENFIMVKEGKGAKKKILTAGALIIKVTQTTRQVGTIADLIKGQPAHLWIEKKAIKKAYQGLVITQFLGAKALASQPPVAQFSVSSSQGSETSAPSLMVSLSKAASTEVKVSYTVSGTATPGGTDYTLANGDLTIATGLTAGMIPLTIINDTAQESDETVLVTLTSATGATLGTQKVHTYTITDDDQTGIGFSSASSSGSESVTTVDFPVTLSLASAQEVQVDYTVTGTATGSGTDYTLANGTATIIAGLTSTNITATIINDTTMESSETIIVTLSNPRGASLTSTAVHTYSITDNDQPTIGFGSASSAGSESVATVNIPVTVSAVSATETRVNYTLTGTALGSGTDYTLANGTLAIPAGQTTANITIAVMNDSTDELDETVILTLSSPVEATLSATAVHTYTIQDNDSPTVQFSSASASGGENATPVTIGLTASAAPIADAVIAYTVTGTATGGGTDYTLANGTATILAGQTTVNISLTIVDDVSVDPGETVIVTISSATNTTLGATTVYTYTITDND